MVVMGRVFSDHSISRQGASQNGCGLIFMDFIRFQLNGFFPRRCRRQTSSPQTVWPSRKAGPLNWPGRGRYGEVQKTQAQHGHPHPHYLPRTEMAVGRHRRGQEFLKKLGIWF